MDFLILWWDFYVMFWGFAPDEKNNGKGLKQML